MSDSDDDFYKNTLVFETTEDGAHYCRNQSTKRDELEKELLEYYNNKGQMECSIFPSGMSAIYTVMYTTMISKMDQKSIKYLIGNELYCDTLKVCKYLEKQNDKMKVEVFDVRKTSQIINLFEKYGNEIALFFIESASNPSGQVFDFSLISDLRKYAPNCLFIVDNTWLTGISLNPFLYNVDLVIESMTKYISGGKCIGGMVIGSKMLMKPIKLQVKTSGLFIGRDHCDIFRDGLSSIGSRISYVSKLSLEVANYLEQNEKKRVSRVMYPMLPSHPTYKIATKYLKFNPGIILFNIISDITPKKLYKIRSSLFKNDFLPFETSYGSAHSKIDQYPHVGMACMFDNDSLEDKRLGIWTRLSIGYESNMQIIIDGLEMIFLNIMKFNSNNFD